MVASWDPVDGTSTVMTPAHACLQKAPDGLFKDSATTLGRYEELVCKRCYLALTFNAKTRKKHCYAMAAHLQGKHAPAVAARSDACSSSRGSRGTHSRSRSRGDQDSRAWIRKALRRATLLELQTELGYRCSTISQLLQTLPRFGDPERLLITADAQPAWRE